MKRRFQFALAALLALTTRPAHATPSPRLDLSPGLCAGLDTLAPDERARVRCGFLRVPEDYAKPTGRIIELAVAVIEPKSNKPADPVVMLHGGPGLGELERYRDRLDEPLGARTLIMFDQRGAGRSRPLLCPELGEAIFEASLKALSVDAETAELVFAHKRCHDRLLAEKFDLTKYNTDTTIADMEVLRTALGFERWKVYGLSYGTAVGLAYLRDHADRLNALVLDSVYPLDASEMATNGVANMMHSLKKMSDTCTAQADCKARFGNVEELFLKTTERLTHEPLEVPAFGATAGWIEPVKIGAPAFMTVVQQMLYDQGAYAVLPYLIERVAARDGEVFAVLVDRFHDEAISYAHGEYAAVECYERFPFDSREAYAQASAAWPVARDNMTLLVRHFDICANWGEKAPAPMTMPGKTTVPALVLAGGWDHITPPADSKGAAERIGARYVELPFRTHNVRADKTCGAPIARAFLDHPDVAPDTSCTKRAAPPVFVTSLIRAPALARELSALSAGSDFATAPATMTLLGLLAFLAISSAMWAVVALTRLARLGSQALARFWTRPGTPLGLAALAVGTTFVAVGIAVVTTATTQSPILLMIGLPSSSLALFALPWLAALCLAWGAWALLFGAERAERAERPFAYAIHLWLVLAAAIAAMALVASFGLLLPEFI